MEQRIRGAHEGHYRLPLRFGVSDLVAPVASDLSREMGRHFTLNQLNRSSGGSGSNGGGPG